MAAAEEADKALIAALQDWRQGDCTLALSKFAVVDGVDSEGYLLAGNDDVEGAVVVSQTCDIVTLGPGKECVVVCPLVKCTDQQLAEFASGRTPRAALLEHPPKPNLVVDLNRMMTLEKALLVKFDRHAGFSTDEARVGFADALQRKHGRFAFPDAFNDHILDDLRNRIAKAHKSEGSENGKAYRSIRATRVRAAPHWEAPDVKVFFRFVLHDQSAREASLDQIAKTIEGHLDALKWPPGFSKDGDGYELVTMDDMTARHWVESQPVDWDFISSRGKPKRDAA